MERKTHGPRRSFTSEFKAGIVERRLACDSSVTWVGKSGIRTYVSHSGHTFLPPKTGARRSHIASTPLVGSSSRGTAARADGGHHKSCIWRVTWPLTIQ